ncbi:hypothetical protein BaRGS_00000558 [Batillaria attramentaria]|uniref:Uncharacterized protein n=1 Tax=Batillaria attramentaria TaxID=370345 RepID=A0ABD0M922_9CAEN
MFTITYSHKYLPLQHCVSFSFSACTVLLSFASRRSILQPPARAEAMRHCLGTARSAKQIALTKNKLRQDIAQEDFGIFDVFPPPNLPLQKAVRV